MSNEKGDKKYCSECGELIKRSSKFCSECGAKISEVNTTARGTESGGSSSGKSNNPTSQPTDSPPQEASRSSTSNNHGANPTNVSAEPTVSDSWHYAVGLGFAFWIVSLLMVNIIPPQLDAIVGLIGLVAWVLPPIAIYFDSKYVGYHSKWDPSAILWGIGSIIPLLNLIVMPVYLVRRHNSVN